MKLRIAAVVVIAGLFGAADGWAQSATTGSIAGTVKDSTGAVLPGVTVEATSPALIEKMRAVVTDSQGNYKLLDLRPGIYAVTYTLPGFTTVRREALELTTGFTANVTVELRVGTVEETVTVTGASPVVDVQNVRYQQVLTRELFDALPTGGKNLQSYVALTLGATIPASGQDVGGVKGDTAGGGTAFSYHGAGRNDSSIFVDGMAFSAQTTGGGAWTRTTHQNALAFEETTIATDISAEQENAGLVLNLVPRDGGNAVTGTFVLNGTGSRFQSSNLSPALIARGVPVQGKVTKLYDLGGGLGGPIMRNRIWYFAADRWWNAKNLVPGSFFNKTPAPAYGLIPVYTPDLSRPAESGSPHHNDNLRVTWQMTNAHKFAFFTELQSACTCYFSASSTRAPEAGQNLTAPYGTKNVFQGTWNYVKGSRWLFSVGNSSFLSSSGRGATTRVAETADTAIPLRDLATGFFWNAAGDDPFPFGVCCTPFSFGQGIIGFSFQHDQRYSATYSTGSHTFKVGARTQEHGSQPGTGNYNVTPYGAVQLQVRGGTNGVPPVPVAVLQLINPIGPAFEGSGKASVFVSAFFAQEQWTLSRLTLNLGVRFDGMHGRFDTYVTAPSEFLDEQTVPAVDDSPAWKDLTPRVGVAWDVFGNGKTAVKGAWGRFVIHETNVGATPASRLGYGGGTRTWSDVNGNYAPDCDFKNPQANGECGRLPNVDRGRGLTPTTFFDEAYITGWGSRPYLWSSSLSVQHEFRPGVAVNAGYFRTSNANLTVTQNRAVTPADFTSYCVTAPTDARLAGVTGSQVCGLYDVSPAKFGQVNNLITQASAFGDPVDAFNGVDVGINLRVRRAMLQGGVSTGRQVTDNCYQNARPDLTASGFVAGTPRHDDYCRVEPPLSALTQVKLFGNYPLPWWGVQVSGTYQNLPGPSVGAALNYTSAQVAPSLGRPLAAGPNGTVSVQLFRANRVYQPRFNQVDVRLTKTFQVQKLRAQAQFDAYNVTNSGAVLALSSTYGALWLRPSSVLGARLFKFGVQVDWK